MAASNPNHSSTQQSSGRPEIRQPQGAPAQGYPPPSPVSQDQSRRQAQPRTGQGSGQSPQRQQQPGQRNPSSASNRNERSDPERNPQPASASGTSDTDDDMQPNTAVTRQDPEERRNLSAKERSEAGDRSES